MKNIQKYIVSKFLGTFWELILGDLGTLNMKITLPGSQNRFFDLGGVGGGESVGGGCALGFVPLMCVKNQIQVKFWKVGIRAQGK